MTPKFQISNVVVYRGAEPIYILPIKGIRINGQAIEYCLDIGWIEESKLELYVHLETQKPSIKSRGTPRSKFKLNQEKYFPYKFRL